MLGYQIILGILGLLFGIGVAAGEGKSATEIIAVSGPRCWMGFDYSRGVDSSAVYGVRA